MQKIVITIVLLFMAAGSTNGRTKRSTVIVIKDARHSKEKPKANAAIHKQHDVDVYRVSDRGNGYWAIYYQEENDSLAHHQFGAYLNTVFDKARYRWDKDTLNIRLFNSMTKKSKTYKAYGYGNSSTMSE